MSTMKEWYDSLGIIGPDRSAGVLGLRGDSFPDRWQVTPDFMFVPPSRPGVARLGILLHKYCTDEDMNRLPQPTKDNLMKLCVLERPKVEVKVEGVGSVDFDYWMRPVCR